MCLGARCLAGRRTARSRGFAGRGKLRSNDRGRLRQPADCARATAVRWNIQTAHTPAPCATPAPEHVQYVSPKADAAKSREQTTNKHERSRHFSMNPWDTLLPRTANFIIGAVEVGAIRMLYALPRHGPPALEAIAFPGDGVPWPWWQSLPEQ